MMVTEFILSLRALGLDRNKFETDRLIQNLLVDEAHGAGALTDFVQ